MQKMLLNEMQKIKNKIKSLFSCARIAQTVEHFAVNEKVVGSRPTVSVIKIQHLFF